MAVTSHGHHIPGSAYEPTPKNRIIGCFGPSPCGTCQEEMLAWYSHHKTSEVKSGAENFTNNEALVLFMKVFLDLGYTFDQAAEVIWKSHAAGVFFRMVST